MDLARAPSVVGFGVSGHGEIGVLFISAISNDDDGAGDHGF